MTKLSGIYWENVLFGKYLIKLLRWSPGINLIFLFDFPISFSYLEESLCHRKLANNFRHYLSISSSIPSSTVIYCATRKFSYWTKCANTWNPFCLPPFKYICVCVLKPANTHSKLAQKPTENVAGLVCVKHIFEFMRKVSLFHLSLFSFRYFFRWANKSFLSAVCMTGNECHGLLSLAMCIIIIIKLI